MTAVKDQSPWATCWGFGAIAASEASILAECYAKWDQLAPGLLTKFGIKSFKELCEQLDLSERQIAWFTSMPEPKNGNYPSQAGEGLYANKEGIGGIYDALAYETMPAQEPETVPENPETVPENAEIIPKNMEIVPENPAITYSTGVHENGRNIPQTGDISNRSLYLVLMVLAAGTLLAAGSVLAASWKKEKSESGRK